MAVEPILPIKRTVTIDTIIKLDVDGVGDGDGDGTCKQTVKTRFYYIVQVLWVLHAAVMAYLRYRIPFQF